MKKNGKMFNENEKKRQMADLHICCSLRIRMQMADLHICCLHMPQLREHKYVALSRSQVMPGGIVMNQDSQFPGYMFENYFMNHPNPIPFQMWLFDCHMILRTMYIPV